MPGDENHGTAIPPDVWQQAGVRRALAHRDITAVYRLLTEAAVSQRNIAELAGQSQSEVSEILAGRRVQSVAVLERIADGLGVPRGWLGLAFTEPPVPSATGEEVSEDVKRRAFLAVVSTALFSRPVLGEVLELPHRPVTPTPLPSRVGTGDVAALRAATVRFWALDRKHGGAGLLEAFSAQAHYADTLTGAGMSEPTRRDLLHAAADAHRLAGWAAVDAGVRDTARHHLTAAMDYSTRMSDAAGMVRALYSAGQLELHFGDLNSAVKLFQLGEIAAPRDSRLAIALLAAMQAYGFARLGGYETAAREQIRRTRAAVDAADFETEPACLRYVLPAEVHGLTGEALAALGDLDGAHADLSCSLAARPATEVRARAFETTTLATVQLKAGEREDGLDTAREGLSLADQVRSRRLPGWLTDLREAAATRGGPSGEQIAHMVRQVQSSQSAA